MAGSEVKPLTEDNVLLGQGCSRPQYYEAAMHEWRSDDQQGKWRGKATSNLT